MQTVYARGGGGGSQQREVADVADVVFTDTASQTEMSRNTTPAPNTGPGYW